MRSKRRQHKQRGHSLLTTFGLVILLSMAGASFIQSSTQTMRDARRHTQEIQATHLSEAGVQQVLLNLWQPFNQAQHFNELETALANASSANPRAAISGSIPGVGAYAAGVVGFVSPIGNPFSRQVRVRSVGWIDRDRDGVLDANEPSKTVDVVAEYALLRSQVFDYTYFVNNYGWFYGFSPTSMIINGDIRANGDMVFRDGAPTVNGSVVGAANSKLMPGATGLVSSAPVKWTDATYRTNVNNTSTPHRTRWRPVYDPAIHGAMGSANFEQWRDLLFESDAVNQTGRSFGAAIKDARGIRGWSRTGVTSDPTFTTLNTTPTDEVVMPDLRDLNHYIARSQSFDNEAASRQRATFADGTANPNFGQPAFIEVFNTSRNRYERVTTDGVLSGSAVLVGTATHPIRIYGPVTVTQDVVIKGHVSGQGTIYAGRNVHIVGSIRYSNPPNFTGTNMQAIENANERRDLLALAARGSIMMGNTTTFTSTQLQFMTPPFTKARTDQFGNVIPAFDARLIDGTGRRLFQSVVPDSTINSLSEGINQVDAILYTNFLGGGNVGVGGGGATFNGSIISRDEAIVAFSTPIRFNYDNRIRERGVNQNPLIDIELPRSPSIRKVSWQDHGFHIPNSL